MRIALMNAPRGFCAPDLENLQDVRLPADERSAEDCADDGALDLRISLAPDEIAAHEEAAWMRFARVVKAPLDEAADRARAMLTEREIARLLQETICARAAEEALDALKVVYLFSPACTGYEALEGVGCAFNLQVFPVPDMELDYPQPQAATTQPASEEAMLAALRDSLEGTIPGGLVSLALKREQAHFNDELAKAGQTDREYRIAHAMKPAQVDAMLRERALQRLEEDIALDLVFLRHSLAIDPAAETCALTEMAPDREPQLKEDLALTGKTHLLAQKSRRRTALNWLMS